MGSWLRRFEAGVKKAVSTPAGQEAARTLQHAAESYAWQAQDAYVTNTLLQSVGPVLVALQPTKDAVVRGGALLILKIDWVIQIHQLTAAQQALLDHQPYLSSPQEIVTALRRPDPVAREDALPSAAHRNKGDEAAAMTAD